MGKDKDKKKKKKDKDKDKDKKKKKDKKKDKEKDKEKPSPEEWKPKVKQNIDNLVIIYQQISNVFQEIGENILPETDDIGKFKKLVEKRCEKMPEAEKQIFIAFLNAIP